MIDNEGEKLRTYVRLSQKTEDEIAELIGVSKSTLQRMYKQVVLNNVQAGKLDRAGIVLDSVKIKTTKNNEDNTTLGVPIYDVDVTAGVVSFCSMEEGKVQGRITHPNYSGLDGFVRVSGDSMEPEFRPGDYIGFKKVNDMSIIQYGQTYIIETQDNQRMLKILKKSENESKFKIHSLNKKYDDFEIPIAKVNGIYLVLARISGF